MMLASLLGINAVRGAAGRRPAGNEGREDGYEL